MDLSIEELLSDAYPNSKNPSDGFLNFHALKICTSNARQMSKYLQLSMGFDEVAYRGLETGSCMICSHVLRNGEIVLEIVNTLESVDLDDDVLTLPCFGDVDDIQKIRVCLNELAFDYVNHKVDNLLVLEPDEKVSSSKIHKQNVSEYVTSTINNSEAIYNDIMETALIQTFLNKHSDGVMDISFLVTDVDTIFTRIINSDTLIQILQAPHIITDNNGSVKLCTIRIPNTDINHTLIENINYFGPYLPNYTHPITSNDDFTTQLSQLPPINLTSLDHCVENYSWNQMMTQASLYATIFGFHKYWSADEQDVGTQFTALRSIVMASSNGKIKMPINEPVKTRLRGQIEEFNDFNGGPGIQHVAFRTNDIVDTVTGLMQRGVEFNVAAKGYYDVLEKRLRDDDVVLGEDLDELKKLNILVDYDKSTRNKRTKKCHYILQIFSKPLHDRPTLFIEIIQRYHHNGFGKGTFKGLFESIEEQQKLRGTLVESD
ncbi:hppD 4-hydroxyphenylpyruvate dioxygenase [Candida maltosa Xu316]